MHFHSMLLYQHIVDTVDGGEYWVNKPIYKIKQTHKSTLEKKTAYALSRPGATDNPIPARAFYHQLCTGKCLRWINVLPLLLCVDAAHRALGFVVGWSASAIGFIDKKREEKRRTNNIDQRGGVDAHHAVEFVTTESSHKRIRRAANNCNEPKKHVPR